MSALRYGFCVALLGSVGGSAVYANVLANPRVEFRQFFALGPNGRVTIENQYGERQHCRRGIATTCWWKR